VAQKPAVVRSTWLAAAALALSVAWAVPALAAPRGEAGLLENLRIGHEVEGDVVVVGGDVVLEPGAHVHGHVVSIFGRVVADPAAQIDGRVLEVTSLSSLTVRESSAAERIRVQWALRLLTTGGWLVATTLLAFLFPVPLRRSARALPAVGPQVLVVGLMAVVTLVAAVVAALGLGSVVAVPVVVAIFLTFIVAKAVGLTLIGATLGARLFAALGRVMPLSAQALVGVLLLLLVRFVPVIGGPVWTLVSVAAVGAGVLAAAAAGAERSMEAARPSRG